MIKVFIVIIIVSSALAAPVRSQSFFAHDTNSTRLERVEYVLGATLAFSLFDYVGFNLARLNFDLDYGHPALMIYHIFQGAVGAAVNYFLYEKLGVPSALSFGLMWWTWVDDLGFYGWSNLINPPDPWRNRQTAVLTENLCCDSWTPVGLVRPDKTGVPRDTMLAQAVIGLAISLAILW